MHAAKALLLVLVLGSVVAAGVFAFVPATRPAVVEGWFRKMRGFGPAKTPDEALTKFKECVKNRDYKTAAEVYCAGDYREQMLKVAKTAEDLGKMIDSLTYNMETKGVVNPNVKYIVGLLEPFPQTFTVKSIKESGDSAVALVSYDETLDKEIKLPDPSFYKKHGKMIYALFPIETHPLTGLITKVPNDVKLVKDASGYWKLDLPVTARLRESVDYLKDNGTNYKNALQIVRDEVKNDPVTKEGVLGALNTRLNETAPR